MCPPETLLTGQEQGPSWEERREVIGMEEILASTLAPASNIVHQGLPANKIEQGAFDFLLLVFNWLRTYK